MAVKDDKKSSGDKKKGDKDGKGGGKKKKLIIIVVAVVAVLGFVAFKILGPKPDPNAPPVPGTIVEVEAVTINLSGAHYLKLALGLQTAAGGGGGHGTEISGALALNAAIEVFHGKSMTELSTAEGREKYRKELAEKLKEAYHDAVYDVYYMSFVMQ